MRSMSPPRSSFPLALDRVAIALMVVLGLLIGVLLWGAIVRLPGCENLAGRVNRLVQTTRRS